MQTKNIVVVVGTRPEAIKLAPLIIAFQKTTWACCQVVLTGQHKDMVVPLLADFGLTSYEDLGAITPNQSLSALTAQILQKFDGLLERSRPDLVIGQGDTASVLATSLASFFHGIPFAHVEAGLRTGNLQLPFPEEMNRVITSRVASWHFAPTAEAQDNLLREGVSADSIWITGNTVIDALKVMVSKTPPALPSSPGREFVLITAHRRENLGAGLASICQAIAKLAALHPELDFIFPVHPNPQVRSVAWAILANQSNVKLIEPCSYPMFCWLMHGCIFILSDSGGVQEEAPALGKPVLVLRNETERPEAVSLGANQLVGTETDSVVASAQALLLDGGLYQRMSTAGSPYGDGYASQKIVDVLATKLGAVL